jgi:hypothetical protein
MQQFLRSQQAKIRQNMATGASTANGNSANSFCYWLSCRAIGCNRVGVEVTRRVAHANDAEVVFNNFSSGRNGEFSPSLGVHSLEHEHTLTSVSPYSADRQKSGTLIVRGIANIGACCIDNVVPL